MSYHSAVFSGTQSKWYKWLIALFTCLSFHMSPCLCQPDTRITCRQSPQILAQLFFVLHTSSHLKHHAKREIHVSVTMNVDDASKAHSLYVPGTTIIYSLIAVSEWEVNHTYELYEFRVFWGAEVRIQYKGLYKGGTIWVVVSTLCTIRSPDHIWLSPAPLELSWMTRWWDPQCWAAAGSSEGHWKHIVSERLLSKCWWKKSVGAIFFFSLARKNVHLSVTALSEARPRPWMTTQVTGWLSEPPQVVLGIRRNVKAIQSPDSDILLFVLLSFAVSSLILHMLRATAEPGCHCFIATL